MRTEGIIPSNKRILQHIQNGFDVITVTNFTHSVHNIHVWDLWSHTYCLLHTSMGFRTTGLHGNEIIVSPCTAWHQASVSLVAARVESNLPGRLLLDLCQNQE